MVMISVQKSGPRSRHRALITLGLLGFPPERLEREGRVCKYETREGRKGCKYETREGRKGCKYETREGRKGCKYENREGRKGP